MTFELFLLFLAGFFGGTLNSIAGGGTFITFPALLFVGVPPVIANATNTFASSPGYLSGLYAFRKDIKPHTKLIPVYILFSFVGGSLGAWLLMETPEKVFSTIIPWLMFIATIIFIFGTDLNRAFRGLGEKNRSISVIGRILTPTILVLVCFYGGFFNAGFGIIALSYLALAGHTDITAMNGLKLLISFWVSVFAIILFALNDAIAWGEGVAVLVGTMTGGYLAARISRFLPQNYVRICVIAISCSITLYFFYDVYL